MLAFLFTLQSFSSRTMANCPDFIQTVEKRVFHILKMTTWMNLSMKKYNEWHESLNVCFLWLVGDSQKQNPDNPLSFGCAL